MKSPPFFSGSTGVLALLLALGTAKASATAAIPASRPNILWITCEDTSLNFGCFGDHYASTPKIDQLAREGVRFTRSFASAPVCSPVRSGIITGLYATSLGTQRLRSTFPVPEEVRPFTAALRAAGYYCVNNSKTDYNLKNEAAFIDAAWDESSARAHWRNRREGQPFFAVFNLMVSHQSRASAWAHAEFEREVGSQLPPNQRHDPAKAVVPPYYPDTPEVRRTLARYYDCVTAMDQQAGDLLHQLAEDGLAEDTVVFFYPDQGMGLPRGKRVLHDTGLQVALVIRFPAKFRHWAPADPGGTCERLVSTIDLGPTVLSLAALPVPKMMQGVPFLGPAAGPPRSYVFGARDRVDEAFDLARSVRDGRWLYIRNFMPHLSWMQPEAYSDQSGMRRELKLLAAVSRLDAAQLTYAAPHRTLEELYDTEVDPHQIHNLAGSKAHRPVLEKLRGELRRWIMNTRDAGFLTEPQMWARLQGNRTPFELARNDRLYPLGKLLEAAEAVGCPEKISQQVRWLAHDHDGMRYWAAVGLHAAGTNATAARGPLSAALEDPSPVVRIEAAAALARLHDGKLALPVLERELRGQDLAAALHAARALELLGPLARPAQPAMNQALAQARRGKGDFSMFIVFSLEAALQSVESKPALLEK